MFSQYYRFLTQRDLDVFQATPADLTEFVIWLCNPHRDVQCIVPIYQPGLLASTSVNLILQAVGSLYHFLVRRGKLAESPVVYVDVPRGKWLKERDLLAHTRRGQAVVQRMELKLKEPDWLPPTISEDDSRLSSTVSIWARIRTETPPVFVIAYCVRAILQQETLCPFTGRFFGKEPAKWEVSF